MAKVALAKIVATPITTTTIGIQIAPLENPEAA